MFDTVSLCLTSKYEVGSSNTYMFAFCKMVIIIVNLWSSPPERLLRDLSIRCLNSRMSKSSSNNSGCSFFFSKIAETFPLIIYGSLSTNYTLKEALYSFSNKDLKKVCNSDPLNLSMTSSQETFLSVIPKLGCIFLVSIYSAVVFPIPLVPTRPKILPFLGIGSLWSINQFSPYQWEICSGKSVGRLIILMASKGHFLTHMLQPIQRVSLMVAHLSDFSTFIHTFP